MSFVSLSPNEKTVLSWFATAGICSPTGDPPIDPIRSASDMIEFAELHKIPRITFTNLAHKGFLKTHCAKQRRAAKRAVDFLESFEVVDPRLAVRCYDEVSCGRKMKEKRT